MNTKAVNGGISDTAADVSFNFLWETDTKECSFTFYYHVQRTKIDADVPVVQRNVLYLVNIELKSIQNSKIRK